MKNKNRHNFQPIIIDAVAKRASYICSNPECRVLTLCPCDTVLEKYIYVGEAAHITAAAPRGPRYDESLTVEQRSSIENAIFLCAVCAQMIDKNNGIDFTTELLKGWKLEHEAWVRSNLNKSFNSLIPNERPMIDVCIQGISVVEREKYKLYFHIPYCSGRNANAYNVKLEAAVILDKKGTFLVSDNDGEFLVLHSFGDAFPTNICLTYDTGYEIILWIYPVNIDYLSRMYICVKGNYKNSSGTLDFPVFDIFKYDDLLKVWLRPAGKEDTLLRKLFDQELIFDQTLKLKNIDGDISY